MPVLVDIVLPCLDEAAALPWVMARIPSGGRALVVDNGSTDGSAAIAADLGATVVDCTQRGYGAACHAGLMAADAPFVAFCDCDGTLNPGAVLSFVELLDAGADMVVGRRRADGRGSWSAASRVANLELARRVRRRTGLRIADVGPLRAARRQPLIDLDIDDRRSGYPVQTVVRAADAGWRVVQQDVAYRPRIGTSKVTGTWRGSLQAVRDMNGVLAR